MRKISEMVILAALYVWSYQIWRCIADEFWTAVSLYNFAMEWGWRGPYLPWPGAERVLVWLLNVNLGTTLVVLGIVLFYASFYCQGVSERRQEKLMAKSRREMADIVARSPDRPIRL